MNGYKQVLCTDTDYGSKMERQWIEPLAESLGLDGNECYWCNRLYGETCSYYQTLFNSRVIGICKMPLEERIAKFRKEPYEKENKSLGAV